VGLVTAVWIVALAFQNLLSEALRGLFAVGMAAWAGGALPNVITGVLLGFVWLSSGSSDLPRVLIITIFGTLVNIVIAALVIHGKLSGVSAAPRASTTAIMKGASALLATTVAQMAFSQCDLWIVGAALAEGDVALYGAAKRLIRLLYFPLLIVTLVVPPIIADLHAKKEFARLERAIRGSATVAGLPAMLALVAMILAGDEILGLAFGDFYRAGGLPLLILSVERMLYVWAGPSGLVLMMTGQERRMLAITMGTGVVQVISTVIGVKSAGIAGAAAGLLFGGALRSSIMWNAARTASRVRTDVDFISLRSTMKLVTRILSGRSH
jgi:O-antigen/teichoic acid export membrane protein